MARLACLLAALLPAAALPTDRNLPALLVANANATASLLAAARGERKVPTEAMCFLVHKPPSRWLTSLVMRYVDELPHMQTIVVLSLASLEQNGADIGDPMKKAHNRIN